MARILIIEDEAEIMSIMQMVLEFEHYDVLMAVDGEEGLDMARRELPDLILLDVLLPKMDGNTVNSHLLKDEKTKRIPVIVITTEPATRNKLAEAPNVKCYLQKPFDVMSMRETIEKVLRRPRPR